MEGKMIQWGKKCCRQKERQWEYGTYKGNEERAWGIKYTKKPFSPRQWTCNALKSHSQIIGHSETLEKHVLSCMKVKLSICTKWLCIQEVLVQRHSFLTSAPGWSKCSASHSGTFAPRERTLNIQWREDNVVLRVGLDVLKTRKTSSPTPRNRTLDCPTHSLVTVLTTLSQLLYHYSLIPFVSAFETIL